jgi:hypothetical protein
VSADRIGQLPTFVMPHVSWWRTNQLGNAVLFHELEHIEANDVLYIIITPQFKTTQARSNESVHW